MQQMNKRYETNKGCKTAHEHLKQGERTKTNLYSIITKLTLIHKNITNSTNIMIVCVYV